MADLPPSVSTSIYYPYLKTKSNKELILSIELGYLSIAPIDDTLVMNSATMTNNTYYPPIGGTQHESNIRNDQLKNQKSKTISQVTNGLIPTSLKISGAPCATFLEGTIDNKPHPYYDLLQGGPNESIPKTTYNPFLNSQTIQQTFSNTLKGTTGYNLTANNAVGEPYVPATSKTSTSIQNLKLKTSTTYNIWQIDNLPYNGGINSSFTWSDYVGWSPAKGSSLLNLQPYAQTIPSTDSAFILCQASNGTISLTRKYPMSQDVTRDSNCQFTMYNTGGDPDQKGAFTSFPLGFNSNAVVGFSLKINATLASTLPQPSSSGTTLTAPKLLISWGNLEFNGESTTNSVYYGGDEATKYPHQTISLYCLDISPGTSPKLYINTTNSQVLDPQNANAKSVELKNLKSLLSTDANAGAKTANDYTLYVFYSGNILKIGNDPDPNKWSAVGPQQFHVGLSSATNINIFDHYLDSNSNINIIGQFMNFSFQYSDILFNPYDSDNTKYNLNSDNLKNTTNTLNFVSNPQTVTISSSQKIDEYVNQKKNKILASLSKYSAPTFDYCTNTKDKNGNVPFGSATVFEDRRQPKPLFNIDIVPTPLSLGYTTNLDSQRYFLFTKITFPKTLAGHVFNYQFDDDDLPETDIKKSFVKYFKDFSSTNIQTNLTPTQVLTESLTSLEVTKNIENDATNLTGSSKLTFLNLNRSETGNALLNFMRKNVAVIKISAGYDKTKLFTYFEGIITKITADESLEKTEFTIMCEDLLEQLFINSKTCIVSRSNVKFFGMEFYDTINYITNKTELHDHFRMELGDPTDPTSLHYKLVYDRTANKSKFRFPPVPVVMVSPNNSAVEFKAYDSKNTYFKVLQTIANFMTIGFQEKQNSAVQDTTTGDAPIFYWYAGKDKEGQPIDGIKFTTRNGKDISGYEKDEDALFIRKQSLLKDDLPNSYDTKAPGPNTVDDINYLHGLVKGGENIFSSTNNTQNLYAEGIYRGLNPLTLSPFSVNLINDTAFEYPSLSGENYIGYNRLLDFGTPNILTSEGYPVSIMGNLQLATQFFAGMFQYYFLQPLEEIQINIYVTQPLKEWGHFRLFFENDKQPVVNDKFFYTSVKYNFKLENNLIEVQVNGGKRPLLT